MSAQDLVSELKVAVTDSQAKKLVGGAMIQLHPSQIGVGPSAIKLDSKKVKKLMKAVQKGKGVRFSMTPKELEINGSGLWDLLKKGVKFLKDNNFLRPILKFGVKNALPLVASVVGTPASGLAVKAVTEKYGDDAIDALGNTLGFGAMKGKGLKGKRKAPKKTGAKKAQPKTMLPPPVPQLANNSNFVSMISPAMNPRFPVLPDQSVSNIFPKHMSKTGMMGGSFKMSGSSFKLAGAK